MEIKPLTLQEQFDLMVTHLRGMKERSHEREICKYLTANGNKCAVGALIPDGHPAQKYVGCAIDLLYRYPQLRDRIDKELGRVMQNFHDDNYNWTSEGLHKVRFNYYINEIADRFNLTIPKGV